MNKMNFNTSVTNLTFIMDLEETAWGKMFVMTVGSFQVFIKIVTLTRDLQFKVYVFPKTSIWGFSVSRIYFSLEDRHVRRSFF